MEEEKAGNMEKLSSAAAFVEGGVQDACDDACSICLEDFCDSDPSTATSCKHEFHLQCILEWCQRSSQCPMCWQAISMKDPLSQELLEAVEHERSVQADRSRPTAVFRHSVLGDFEVPVGADGVELEERIMQHLVAAASRRSHRQGRREGRRGRSAPRIVVSSATDATSNETTSSDSRRDGDTEHSLATISARPLAPVDARAEASVDVSAQDDNFANIPVGSDNRISGNQSSPVNQDEAGPSALHSFSDTLKTRFQSVSTKYKDSITKNTRGWKERWFTQSNTISSLGSNVRREVNAGMAAVSRMMELLDVNDSTGPSSISSGNTMAASETNNDPTAASSYSGTAPANDTSSSATCSSRPGSQ